MPMSPLFHALHKGAERKGMEGTNLGYVCKGQSLSWPLYVFLTVTINPEIMKYTHFTNAKTRSWPKSHDQHDSLRILIRSVRISVIFLDFASDGYFQKIFMTLVI